MINIEALFKITYGLYIVSAGDKDSGNGFISNTVFQVTAEPAKFAACCNKNNYTAEFIQKFNFFSVSVLQQYTSQEIFSRFGYKSGREINKFEGLQIEYGQAETPIVLNDAISFLECKLVQTIDVGTHWMFIGELLNAELVNNNLEVLTYKHYRDVKKGIAPKNAPTYIDKAKFNNSSNKSVENYLYKCNACGFIYDDSKESIKFPELTKDWKCPICGADLDDFEKNS